MKNYKPYFEKKFGKGSLIDDIENTVDKILEMLLEEIDNTVIGDYEDFSEYESMPAMCAESNNELMKKQREQLSIIKKQLKSFKNEN